MSNSKLPSDQSPPSHHILIAGFGDIGAAVARALAAQGMRVSVLSRRYREDEAGIRHQSCDLADAQQVAVALKASDAEFALLCLSPDNFTAAAYESVFEQGTKNFLSACPPTLQRIFFVSSTSVYGQLQGEWVDEDSAIEPAGFSGRSLHRAESLLRDSSIASVAIRFAGIYGRTSKRLLAKALRGEYSRNDGGASPYTNRIHREDCIAALVFLIRRACAGQDLHDCYLVADNTPVTQQDLQSWLQAEYIRRYGALPQRDTAAATAENSPGRRIGSKRCSNQRLRDAGYTLLYPDYRRGYAEIIAALGVSNN